MLSLHFNKQIFINALKAENSIVYIATTLALIVTLTFHGMLQGNLKLEYFAYALVVSMAFSAWGMVDQKFRPLSKDSSQKPTEKMDE